MYTQGGGTGPRMKEVLEHCILWDEVEENAGKSGYGIFEFLPYKCPNCGNRMKQISYKTISCDVCLTEISNNYFATFAIIGTLIFTFIYILILALTLEGV
mgnify:CR=1 FL=1